MMAVISYKLEGESQARKHLETQGSRVRDNVTWALVKITAEAVQAAKAAAPTQRTADGILSFGTEQPNAWNEYGSGSGMPQGMIDEISRAVGLSGRGELITVIENTYYLGRFRDEGFDDKVEVRGHTRRAPGRKSWSRPRNIQRIIKSFRAQYGELDWKPKARRVAKGYGWTDRKLRLIFNRKGGQVSVNFYRRRHRVTKTPFFSSTMEPYLERFHETVGKALEEGMALQ